jgi:hypothetical protein
MNETPGDRGGSGDAAEALRQSQATKLLMERGASDLPRRPWLVGRQPQPARDLIEHVLWRANGTGRGETVDGPDVRAALTLISAARAELEAQETALLFLARAEGLTWPQIAENLGLRSAQAAQQRLDRLSGRPQSGVVD